MSEMNEHRQAIVRALIHSVRDLDSKVSPLAFTDNGVQEKEQEEHPCLNVCIATSLLFPHNDTCGLGCLSAGCITFSSLVSRSFKP